MDLDLTAAATRVANCLVEPEQRSADPRVWQQVYDSTLFILSTAQVFEAAEAAADARLTAAVAAFVSSLPPLALP